ncbi:cold shock domain-containing protein [Streptomyces axinellae]|uniref:Cold shock domain-containing protein n=1 Tax=Streptomyces axinellae TaxID=552788 RepID=A0ABN3Q5C8_9ACTN
MVAGRVVRFDGARGYGFIAPDHGGEDVFLHANDLLIPESYVHSGVAVEFEIEDGDRGLKASSVRLPPGAEPPLHHPSAGHAPGPRSEDGEDPMCDVLSVAEYTRSVTELLLAAAPTLTGQQILEIRRHLVQFGKNHGWAED